MKKIIAFMLTLAMIFGVAAIPASAAVRYWSPMENRILKKDMYFLITALLYIQRTVKLRYGFINIGITFFNIFQCSVKQNTSLTD